jgi:hypothetical protein
MKKNKIRVLRAVIALFITLSIMMASIQATTIDFEKSIMKKSKQKQWTTFFYLDHDYGNVPYDPLEEDFIDEIASSDSVNVVVILDTLDGPAFYYYIDENHSKILLEELGEVNMADYQTLKDFLEYGKQHYPSDSYLLWVVDHGGAWKGACMDVTSDELSMTMDEIQQALDETGGVDVICFLACLMGSLEAVYELRNLVDVYVGSEDLAYGSGWDGVCGDINQFLTNFPESTNEEVGEEIVNSFVEQANPPFDKLTMSAFRTDNVETLTESINSLAKHFITHWLRSYGKVKKAHDNTFMLADLGSWAEVFEVYDLKDFIQNLPENEKTTEVLNAIDDVIITEYHGEDETEAHGLSIFFQPRVSPNKLYREYIKKKEGLDFPKDTLWDEFLFFFILTNRLLFV